MKIVRRIVLPLAVLWVIGAGVAWAQTHFSRFSDVPDHHPQVSDIEYAVDQGWFQGYPDGTFRPDRKLTADQAATVIGRAFPDGISRADLATILRDGQDSLADLIHTFGPDVWSYTTGAGALSNHFPACNDPDRYEVGDGRLGALCVSDVYWWDGTNRLPNAQPFLFSSGGNPFSPAGRARAEEMAERGGRVELLIEYTVEYECRPLSVTVWPVVVENGAAVLSGGGTTDIYRTAPAGLLITVAVPWQTLIQERAGGHIGYDGLATVSRHSGFDLRNLPLVGYTCHGRTPVMEPLYCYDPACLTSTRPDPNRPANVEAFSFYVRESCGSLTIEVWAEDYYRREIIGLRGAHTAIPARPGDVLTVEVPANTEVFLWSWRVDCRP